MNSTPLKLTALLFIGMLLFSCSKDDTNIYENEINSGPEAAPLNYSNIESEIFVLVNNYRENLGLTKLQVLDIISNVASTHTSYMVENNVVNHSNFELRTKNLIENANAEIVGENVAFGFQSADGVFNGWLQSDGHRKIIENPTYTHFGISIKSDSEGRNYFTQIFIKKN